MFSWIRVLIPFDLLRGAIRGCVHFNYLYPVEILFSSSHLILPHDWSSHVLWLISILWYICVIFYYKKERIEARWWNIQHGNLITVWALILLVYMYIAQNTFQKLISTCWTLIHGATMCFMEPKNVDFIDMDAEQSELQTLPFKSNSPVPKYGMSATFRCKHFVVIYVHLWPWPLTSNLQNQ